MINGIIGIHVDIDAIYVIRQIILFHDILDKVKIDLFRRKILEIPLRIQGDLSENFCESIPLNNFLIFYLVFSCKI